MEKNNSEKTFSHYLHEIENSAEFLQTYPDGSVAGMADKIVSDVGELKKALAGIRLMLLLLLLVAIICAVITGFTLSSNKFRNYFVNDRTALKDSLLELDDLDSSIKYKIQDGKMVTYQDLIKENDTLLLKYRGFERELNVLQSELDLCNILLKSAENNSTFYQDLYDLRTKEDISDLSKNIDNLKRIDSGRILLEAFRDKMIYDPTTKTWKIDVNRK